MSDNNKTIAEFLSENYGDSELTWMDLVVLGEALVTTAWMPFQMGWSSPAGWLDYAGHDGEANASEFMQDFVAWTSGRKQFNEGARERMRSYLIDYGKWDVHKTRPADENGRVA